MMKITRVRVKTAVCAIVLSTTGSVMSAVNATGPYSKPLFMTTAEIYCIHCAIFESVP